jgi:hypothetical protein
MKKIILIAILMGSSFGISSAQTKLNKHEYLCLIKDSTYDVSNHNQTTGDSINNGSFFIREMSTNSANHPKSYHSTFKYNRFKEEMKKLELSSVIRNFFK